MAAQSEESRAGDGQVDSASADHASVDGASAVNASAVNASAASASTNRNAAAPSAPRPAPTYTPEFLRSILKETTSIAPVGVSTNTVRPSFYVVKYLQSKGYRISPVNPVYAGKEVIGETIYPSLADIPRDRDPIEMVEIFRRSEAAGEVVDEAIATLKDRGLKTIWMQIGVVNWPAAERAEAAGLRVVMDRCPKIEYARLFGELRWGGFNTGVISSKL